MSSIFTICAVITLILLGSIYLALGEVVDELRDMVNELRDTNAIARGRWLDEYKRGRIAKPRREAK